MAKAFLQSIGDWCCSNKDKQIDSPNSTQSSHTLLTLPSLHIQQTAPSEGQDKSTQFIGDVAMYTIDSVHQGFPNQTSDGEHFMVIGCNQSVLTAAANIIAPSITVECPRCKQALNCNPTIIDQQLTNPNMPKVDTEIKPCIVHCVQDTYSENDDVNTTQDPTTKSMLKHRASEAGRLLVPSDTASRNRSQSETKTGSYMIKHVFSLSSLQSDGSTPSASLHEMLGGSYAASTDVSHLVSTTGSSTTTGQTPMQLDHELFTTPILKKESSARCQAERILSDKHVYIVDPQCMNGSRKSPVQFDLANSVNLNNDKDSQHSPSHERSLTTQIANYIQNNNYLLESVATQGEHESTRSSLDAQEMPIPGIHEAAIMKTNEPDNNTVQRMRRIDGSTGLPFNTTVITIQPTSQLMPQQNIASVDQKYKKHAQQSKKNVRSSMAVGSKESASAKSAKEKGRVSLPYTSHVEQTMLAAFNQSSDDTLQSLKELIPVRETTSMVFNTTMPDEVQSYLPDLVTRQLRITEAWNFQTPTAEIDIKQLPLDVANIAQAITVSKELVPVSLSSGVLKSNPGSGSQMMIGSDALHLNSVASLHEDNSNASNLFGDLCNIGQFGYSLGVNPNTTCKIGEFGYHMVRVTINDTNKVAHTAEVRLSSSCNIGGFGYKKCVNYKCNRNIGEFGYYIAGVNIGPTWKHMLEQDSMVQINDVGSQEKMHISPLTRCGSHSLQHRHSSGTTYKTEMWSHSMNAAQNTMRKSFELELANSGINSPTGEGVLHEFDVSNLFRKLHRLGENAGQNAQSESQTFMICDQSRCAAYDTKPRQQDSPLPMKCNATSCECRKDAPASDLTRSPSAMATEPSTSSMRDDTTTYLGAYTPLNENNTCTPGRSETSKSSATYLRTDKEKSLLTSSNRSLSKSEESTFYDSQIQMKLDSSTTQ